MLEVVLEWDKNLFHLLNGIWINHFFDFLMPFITNKANFFGIMIAGWSAIFLLAGNKGKKTAIVVLLVILASDQTAGFLKEVFHRTRPCGALHDVRLLVGCGNSYSFPSNHAANISAGMAYLSYNYKRLFPVLFTFAILVAYSRVYVGVHYPVDVLGGVFLGFALSGSVILLEKNILAGRR